MPTRKNWICGEGMRRPPKEDVSDGSGVRSLPSPDGERTIYVTFSRTETWTRVVARRGVNGPTFTDVQCDHVLSRAEEVQWNTFLRDAAQVVDRVRAASAPPEPTGGEDPEVSRILADAGVRSMFDDLGERIVADNGNDESIATGQRMVVQAIVRAAGGPPESKAGDVDGSFWGESRDHVRDAGFPGKYLP